MLQAPLATVASGVLAGIRAGGVAAFLGVPYAAPPFGANRMRPPQPVAPWTGTRAATAYGPTAPKGDYPPQYQPFFPEVVIPGDDCLNLNVWTPDPAARGLPVLVWIHGGSFMNGSGSVGEYDGSAFARAGIVCVTLNYRLAAEGFLYLGDDTANLGLQDQLAALGWVQANIAAFGGDPARVTVAGESAGAMSVTALLAMPRAEGLFAQAIAQSGAAHSLTPEQGQMVGGYLAAALGVPATRAALAAVPLATLVQAASALVVEVQTTPDPLKWGPLALTLLPFAPTIDGAVLPREPLAAIADGQGRGVPLLIGTNRDEARLFLVAAGVIDFIDEPTLAATATAYGLWPAGLDVYRAQRPGASAGDLMAAIIGDWTFGIPCLRIAEARVARGGAPTWVYRFDHPSPAANGGLGACHGVELPFVFGTTALAETHARIGAAPSAAVADVTHAAWVGFITQGSPGFAPYALPERPTALIGERIEVVSDPGAAERALWDGIR